MNDSNSALDGRKEACKSYIEQIKLLVTLASGFLIAPAAALPLAKAKEGFQLSRSLLPPFFWSEGCFILSVLLGYVSLATIAGTQDAGDYDVYRPATRITSILQFLSYLVGLIFFVLLVSRAVISA